MNYNALRTHYALISKQSVASGRKKNVPMTFEEDSKCYQKYAL